jgi:hypothetical protein
MKLADLKPGQVYLVKGYSSPGLHLYKGETEQQLTSGYKGRKVTVARMHKITEHEPTPELLALYEQSGRIAPRRGNVEEQSRKIPSVDIAEEYAGSVEEALAKRDAEQQAQEDRVAKIEATLDALEEVTGLAWRYTGSSYCAYIAVEKAQLFIELQRAQQS